MCNVHKAATNMAPIIIIIYYVNVHEVQIQ